MMHSHHNGRATKSAIAGGEHLRIGSAHCQKIRLNLATTHESRVFQRLADSLLPNRRYYHAARNLKRTTVDNYRSTATIRIGRPGFSSNALQHKAIRNFQNTRLQGIVDKFNALFLRMV